MGMTALSRTHAFKEGAKESAVDRLGIPATCWGVDVERSFAYPERNFPGPAGAREAATLDSEVPTQKS